MSNPKGNAKNLTNRNGRPKGAKNKFTDLKAAFLKAFEEIGGTEELVAWGMKPQNRSQFYQMLTKLFPKEVAVDMKVEGETGVVILPAREDRDKKKGK